NITIFGYVPNSHGPNFVINYSLNYYCYAVHRLSRYFVFFVLLIGIGIYSYFKVDSSADFFTAGGKLPWWLSGVSHHVSGYSGAVFVAYASIAYTHGFVMYVWWALTITIAMIGTIYFIAQRWARRVGR